MIYEDTISDLHGGKKLLTIKLYGLWLLVLVK